METPLVTISNPAVLIHFPPIHSCHHFCCPLGHWGMSQPIPAVLGLQPEQVTSLSQGHMELVSTTSLRVGSGHFVRTSAGD